MKVMTAGQLMLEILVGLGIITTALVVSLSVVTHATKLAREARNKLEATKYAEKVLEEFRNTRDKNKATFFVTQTCNNPCGTFGQNNMYSCSMSCTWGTNKVDVTVTMTWSNGSTNSTVVIPTVLTLFDL